MTEKKKNLRKFDIWVPLIYLFLNRLLVLLICAVHVLQFSNKSIHFQIWNIIPSSLFNPLSYPKVKIREEVDFPSAACDVYLSSLDVWTKKKGFLCYKNLIYSSIFVYEKGNEMRWLLSFIDSSYFKKKMYIDLYECVPSSHEDYGNIMGDAIPSFNKLWWVSDEILLSLLIFYFQLKDFWKQKQHRWWILIFDTWWCWSIFMKAASFFLFQFRLKNLFLWINYGTSTFPSHRFFFEGLSFPLRHSSKKEALMEVFERNLIIILISTAS